MNFDPHIPPVESSTLSPESLQFCSDLAERISITLRSLATGRHGGSVTLDEAVRELDALAGEGIGLGVRLTGMYYDGIRQRAVIRHAAGGR